MPYTSAFLDLTTRDAASCPFPPAPDLPSACTCCPDLPHFAFSSLRGGFPSCTLHSRACVCDAFPSHTHKYTAGTSSPAGISIALCPSSCSQFSHSQHGSRGWPGRKPGVVHPPELLPSPEGVGARHKGPDKEGFLPKAKLKFIRGLELCL